jgi:hypothetical protein
MKFSIIFLFLTSLGQLAFSNPVELNDLNFIKTGLRQAPIVQCPRPQKKYQDMLLQLDDLKAKIKSEACNDKALTAINNQVTDLETIIVDGRINFVELIKKGTSVDQQLTANEVESLQKYIDLVVKKVASVTGLLKNEACFNDETKSSTLSFLSSIIGEVSGAIGAVSGPFGAKISLGGKLAAGLLGSIDSIIQARKTYDYRKYEDQKNYLNNLCSYYDFKSDLDKETSVFDYYDRVYLLEDVASQFLDKLSLDCSECRSAIQSYNSMQAKGDNFVVERRSDRNEVLEIIQSDRPSHLPLIETEPADKVYSKDGLMESVAASDVTFRELSEILYQDFIMPIDGGAVQPAIDEPVEVAKSYKFDQREMTLRALQAQSWAQAEIESLELNDSSGITDDGRREVIRVQKQLESFLVNREAVNYIKYYSDLLLKDFRNLNYVVGDIGTQFYYWEVKKDPNFDENNSKNYNVLTINDIFRSDLDFSIVLSDYITSAEQKEFMAAAKRNVLNALEPIRVDYSLLTKRCQFFTKSLFKNNESTIAACERMEYRRKEIKQFFIALQSTSLNLRYSKFLTFVDENNDIEVADWLASVTETFTMNLESMQ